jgi:hypothetical protein
MNPLKIVFQELKQLEGEGNGRIIPSYIDSRKTLVAFSSRRFSLSI